MKMLSTVSITLVTICWTRIGHHCDTSPLELLGQIIEHLISATPPPAPLKCLACPSTYYAGDLNTDQTGCPSGAKVADLYQDPNWIKIMEQRLQLQTCTPTDNMCAFILMEHPDTKQKSMRRMCGYILGQRQNQLLLEHPGVKDRGVCMEPPGNNRPEDVRWCFCSTQYCNWRSWADGIQLPMVGPVKSTPRSGPDQTEEPTVQGLLTTTESGGSAVVLSAPLFCVLLSCLCAQSTLKVWLFFRG